MKNPWFWKEPRFLRPGCSIIRASLTVALMVSLPSQISAFCALAARSPCICSRLRVALRCAQQPTGLTLPSGALRVALPPPVASAHRAHAFLRAFGVHAVQATCLSAARLRAGPIPTLRSLWHRPSLRRTQATRALRAPERRKKRGSPQNQEFFNGLSLAAQGCRIRRACQRGRPPAGSGQPVPRSRGMPSPNQRFGEGTGDSDFSLESCGSPNL